jgi:hypothetical protein
MDSRAILQDQIQKQRGNMRISLAFSVALLMIGVLLTIWSVSSERTAGFSEIMKIGPMLITSAVAALPLKAFLSYRMRIAAYDCLLRCPESDPTAAPLIATAIQNILKVE